MENALYYTLSTIAQTLAGALAVMVAFVLFRLGRLIEIIRNVWGIFRALELDAKRAKVKRYLLVNG